MMKFGLVSLFSLLGVFNGVNNANKIPSLSEVNNLDANKSIYVLASNIIQVDNKQTVNFETINYQISNHDEIINESITYKLKNDDENWIISSLGKDYTYSLTYNTLNNYIYSSKNYFTNVLEFYNEDTLIDTVSIYAIPSYINFSEDKLNISVIKNSEFEVKLVDGDGVINVDQKEIYISHIADDNLIEEEKTLIALPYGKTFKSGDNIGETIVKYEFKKDLDDDNKLEVIRSFDISISVVDGTFYFYELNENNEFIEINSSKYLELEGLSLKELYIGNINDDSFDSNNFVLANEYSTYFQLLDTSNYEQKINDKIFKFLKLRILTNGIDGTIQVKIKAKNNKNVYKEINIKIKGSNYKISINEDNTLNKRYFILDPINFSKITNLIKVYENNKLIEIDNYDVNFIQSNNYSLLGKNNIIVNISINNMHIFSTFNVYITMDGRFSSTENSVSTDNQITLYKSLLNKARNSTLSSYTLKERYDDLEYEYLNSLSNETKNALANDFEFIRNYRNFILENNFKESFFREISINLGFSRLILPITIISVSSILLIMTLSFSLYYIYHQKGKDQDEK